MVTRFRVYWASSAKWDHIHTLCRRSRGRERRSSVIPGRNVT